MGYTRYTGIPGIPAGTNSSWSGAESVNSTLLQLQNSPLRGGSAKLFSNVAPHTPSKKEVYSMLKQTKKYMQYIHILYMYSILNHDRA